MSTLAQVQAETLSDDVTRLVVAEQFARDWLLVAENDQETYEEVMHEAQDATVPGLSDKLREEWETLAEQVTGLVSEHISETASLFIAQILQGQGSLPFDIIAREFIGKFEEQN